jgi:hypothetical protein
VRAFPAFRDYDKCVKKLATQKILPFVIFEILKERNIFSVAYYLPKIQETRTKTHGESYRQAMSLFSIAF